MYTKKKKTYPPRKSRTKTRKPKYLSLKLQLSPNKTQLGSPKMSPKQQQQQQQQLNLFPLHPELNINEDQDVAFLFETATDTSTSLHGILDLDHSTTTTTSEDAPPCAGHVIRDQKKLVKTAMKRKERDASEERWVSYWEVVEKKLDQEEVSSCSYGGGGGGGEGEAAEKKGLVGLKLDYEHILNVWSDKGPLYINGVGGGGDSPQTVPDLLHLSNRSEVGNIWKVPEMEKVGKREASVLRYKEKRQSRLFAKRIRYQVRKLNAEKRPRLKGRFVKRNGEND